MLLEWVFPFFAKNGQVLVFMVWNPTLDHGGQTFGGPIKSNDVSEDTVWLDSWQRHCPKISSLGNGWNVSQL